VKFLIDNNLSPLPADALKAAGHDAVHVRDRVIVIISSCVYAGERADNRELVEPVSGFEPLTVRLQGQ
jgi:predicted nuclease of predicted toxin-antitoxin system